MIINIFSENKENVSALPFLKTDEDRRSFAEILN